MTKKKMLYEKWTVHKWPKEGFYLGPEHGREAVVTYKDKHTAEMALEMRNWIAKELKKFK